MFIDEISLENFDIGTPSTITQAPPTYTETNAPITQINECTATAVATTSDYPVPQSKNLCLATCSQSSATDAPAALSKAICDESSTETAASTTATEVPFTETEVVWEVPPVENASSTSEHKVALATPTATTPNSETETAATIAEVVAETPEEVSSSSVAKTEAATTEADIVTDAPVKTSPSSETTTLATTEEVDVVADAPAETNSGVDTTAVAATAEVSVDEVTEISIAPMQMQKTLETEESYWGTDGNDVFNSRTTDLIIHTSAGHDIIILGNGSNTIIVEKTTGHSVIKDFDANEDQLALAAGVHIEDTEIINDSLHLYTNFGGQLEFENIGDIGAMVM